jgi:phosphotransferase system HPr-like phosphotransfer protein
MATFKIKFNKFSDLKDFIDVTNQFKGKVTARSENGDKEVSANSPLSLFSLNWGNPIIFETDNEQDEILLAKLYEKGINDDRI